MRHIRVRTDISIAQFEEWLDDHAEGTWEVSLDDIGELDESKTINKAIRALVFSFSSTADLERFKDAYKSGDI